MSERNQTPMRLGRIAAILPVSDIQASYRLYHHVFGFEKVFENGDPAVFMILKKDDAELQLSQHAKSTDAEFNVAHMIVSDARKAHDQCRLHGLEIVKALEDKDYGLRAFVFADPDGNRIDVGEPI